MGFFSFKTSDTNESIINVHARGDSKTIYMLQPNNQPHIVEFGYQGYGIFGGVDVFIWLIEQNAHLIGFDLKKLSDDNIRDMGVELWHEQRNRIKFPLKFSFDPGAVYENLPAAKDCPYQGFIP